MTIQRIAILTLALALITTAGCDKQDEPQTKAVTGATTAYTNPDMPRETDTYEVLGYLKGIKGYVVKYNDDLYRGGEILARAGIEKLQSYGVKTIITITPSEVEQRLAKDLGINLIEMPFENGAIPAETFTRYIETITSDKGPYYIHCHGGNHRAGALCAAYRVHKQDWSWQKAAIEFGQLGGSLQKDHAMIQSIKQTPALAEDKPSQPQEPVDRQEKESLGDDKVSNGLRVEDPGKQHSAVCAP
ncbi:Protein tyrosine/serine phosphatase [Anaerohalosphaera lusitana]|uniref:Protein tyrosine/serine phosphatase n=1 Tax=Anaerohalosphaera lusitana TaxID=1936003 RepID=A0A1U9NNY6_9BACT|nr:dual specificity protein phosphatase family protein [Anaerohalosphaera lusitana]AQT69662.1 Protein tyrosine/serine phosphatase [Anaerohalosphaera lusitana]